jgi:hypothetical protein
MRRIESEQCELTQKASYYENRKFIEVRHRSMYKYMNAQYMESSYTPCLHRWGWGPIHSNVTSLDEFGAFDSISGIKLPKNSHLDKSCVFFICTDDFTWVPRIPGH